MLGDFQGTTTMGVGGTDPKCSAGSTDARCRSIHPDHLTIFCLDRSRTQDVASWTLVAIMEAVVEEVATTTTAISPCLLHVRHHNGHASLLTSGRV